MDLVPEKVFSFTLISDKTNFIQWDRKANTNENQRKSILFLVTGNAAAAAAILL
jgi:hypothetical protein